MKSAEKIYEKKGGLKEKRLIRKERKKKKNNKRTQIIYRLAVAHGLKKKNYIETELRLLVHTNPFSTTDLHRLQVSNF